MELDKRSGFSSTRLRSVLAWLVNTGGQLDPLHNTSLWLEQILNREDFFAFMLSPACLREMFGECFTVFKFRDSFFQVRALTFYLLLHQMRNHLNGSSL